MQRSASPLSIHHPEVDMVVGGVGQRTSLSLSLSWALLWGRALWESGRSGRLWGLNWLDGGLYTPPLPPPLHPHLIDVIYFPE